MNIILAIFFYQIIFNLNSEWMNGEEMWMTWYYIYSAYVIDNVPYIKIYDVILLYY